MFLRSPLRAAADHRHQGRLPGLQPRLQARLLRRADRPGRPGRAVVPRRRDRLVDRRHLARQAPARAADRQAVPRLVEPPDHGARQLLCRLRLGPAGGHRLRWGVSDSSSVPPGFRRVDERSGFAEANGPWFEKIEGGRLIRGFLPGPQHSNSHGIVHGGMLAAFLDSVMGSTVFHVLHRRCVTVRLTHRLPAAGPRRPLAAGRGRGAGPRRAGGAGAGPPLWSAPRRAGRAGRLRAAAPPARAEDPELSVSDDNPPEGFLAHRFRPRPARSDLQRPYRQSLLQARRQGHARRVRAGLSRAADTCAIRRAACMAA